MPVKAVNFAVLLESDVANGKEQLKQHENKGIEPPMHLAVRLFAAFFSLDTRTAQKVLRN